MDQRDPFGYTHLVDSSFVRLELLTNNCDYELAGANLWLPSGS